MLGLADHDRVPLPDVDPGGIVLLHGVGQVRGLELVDACPQGGKVEAVDIIEVDVQRKRVTAGCSVIVTCWPVICSAVRRINSAVAGGRTLR